MAPSNRENRNKEGKKRLKVCPDPDSNRDLQIVGIWSSIHRAGAWPQRDPLIVVPSLSRVDGNPRLR